MAIPAPEITPEAKPYWDALAEGRLTIQACKACGNRFHYPRPFCPSCMSDEVERMPVSGNGTIYSFSLVRNRGEIASAPVFVTLDEGPTLLSALIDCDFEKLAIGQKVHLKLVPSENGPPIPFFTV
jgi:uncharacterized OB-fold protein